MYIFYTLNPERAVEVIRKGAGVVFSGFPPSSKNLLHLVKKGYSVVLDEGFKLSHGSKNHEGIYLIENPNDWTAFLQSIDSPKRS